jgi:hypothetical protein
LAVEEAIGGEACDGGHGAGEPIPQRTNDGDMGQFGADEFAGYREDQAGLNQWIERVEKIWNDRPDIGSLNGATGCCTPFPAKSTHSRK